MAHDELLADAPHELAVIADFALYHVHREGGNAVERYRDARRPSTKSHDGALLAALTAARCSAFQVDAVEAGVGIAVTDRFGCPVRFVVDHGIATIAGEGVCFVAHLITVDGATITTGPALPLDKAAQDEVNDDLLASSRAATSTARSTSRRRRPPNSAPSSGAPPST